MNKLLFILMIVVSARVEAQVPNTHLIVSGHLGEGSRIYNCLSYQRCDTIQTEFVGPVTDGRVHLFIPRGEYEIISNLSHCDLSAFHGTLQIEKNEKTEDLTWIRSSFIVNLAPALLPDVSEESIKGWISEVQTNVEEKNWKAALNIVLTQTRWNLRGYSLKVLPRLIKFAVTDHIKKKIKLPGKSIQTAHDFIFYLRHELEHVQQVEFDDQCKMYHLSSSYSDHTDRERAAHLADITGAELYNHQDIYYMMYDRWDIIQEKYWHVSP